MTQSVQERAPLPSPLKVAATKSKWPMAKKVVVESRSFLLTFFAALSLSFLYVTINSATVERRPSDASKSPNQHNAQKCKRAYTDGKCVRFSLSVGAFFQVPTQQPNYDAIVFRSSRILSSRSRPSACSQAYTTTYHTTLS